MLSLLKTLLNKKIVVENSSDIEIPVRDYNKAVKNPFFRKKLRDISVAEDEENPYYSGILNTYAEHSVGSLPQIMVDLPSPEDCDRVEDSWNTWCIETGVATSLRLIRRAALRTGVGIGIPIKDSNPNNPLGFKLKCVSGERLRSPGTARLEDRIVDGVEYDENGEPVRIFLKDESADEPKEYRVEDIIFWWKQRVEEQLPGIPECGPAFCIFPSVKRIIEAVVKAEEFRSCIPLAVELDPNVYRPADAATPAGRFKYEPGFVPTLPPGTKLTGVNTSNISEDRSALLHSLIAAAARCLQMPKNLAIADSSNSNMATAAIDIQPWSATIKTDRVDFAPVIRKVVRWWHQRAILVTGYLPVTARNKFTYEINYDMAFEHPDPSKRANARAIDLKSGSSTLSKVYTDQGLNPRKQLDREARTLGITREELNKMIIAQRLGMIIESLVDENTGDTNED
ncbi:MAG: hypothetical protein KatS3mg087_1375 [Patescibacteria group bacterium]|nr:MAG: hypothetical protein KatS3mg087_1375 [Patescibacteria group bacterium]